MLLIIYIHVVKAHYKINAVVLKGPTPPPPPLLNGWLRSICFHKYKQQVVVTSLPISGYRYGVSHEKMLEIFKFKYI